MPGNRSYNTSSGSQVGQLPPEDIIFGCSEAMQTIRQKLEKACRTNIPLLIQGFGGTGKEVLARWVHCRSPWGTGPFAKVSCAAIPGTLLESELFGYEKGAFTGASSSKPGRVELANDGTLFLDEIAELDIGLQSKLLHFLQDGCFSRIGDSVERVANSRVICATQRDLTKEVDGGRFRPDLFYRINVVQLSLPRLCERREDIPALAEYFRTYHMKQFGKECESLRPEMIEYFQNLPWPGNMRELSNGIARYVLIGPEATISQEHAQKRPTAPSSVSPEIPLKRIAKEAIRDMERSVLLEALRAHQWNRRKTAQTLKISYRALMYKIRNAGLALRLGKASTIAQPNGAPQTGHKTSLPAE